MPDNGAGYNSEMSPEISVTLDPNTSSSALVARLRGTSHNLRFCGVRILHTY